MFVFPSTIAIVVGFIGMRFGNDSPEAYGLGTVEELFDEEISEEDTAAAEENQMTKKEICSSTFLKTK